MKSVLITVIVVAATGVFVATAVTDGEDADTDEGAAASLDVEGREPVHIGRIECPEPNVVRVLDPYVELGPPLPRIPKHASAWFRVTTGYPTDMLYARRPERRGRNFGKDLASGVVFAPGTYTVRMPIERGRWLIGCVGEPAGDHADEGFDLIHVVRTD